MKNKIIALLTISLLAQNSDIIPSAKKLGHKNPFAALADNDSNKKQPQDDLEKLVGNLVTEEFARARFQESLQQASHKKESHHKQAIKSETPIQKYIYKETGLIVQAKKYSDILKIKDSETTNPSFLYGYPEDFIPCGPANPTVGKRLDIKFLTMLSAAYAEHGIDFWSKEYKGSKDLSSFRTKILKDGTILPIIYEELES